MFRVKEISKYNLVYMTFYAEIIELKILNSDKPVKYINLFPNEGGQKEKKKVEDQFIFFIFLEILRTTSTKILTFVFFNTKICNSDKVHTTDIKI